MITNRTQVAITSCINRLGIDPNDSAGLVSAYIMAHTTIGYMRSDDSEQMRMILDPIDIITSAIKDKTFVETIRNYDLIEFFELNRVEIRSKRALSDLVNLIIGTGYANDPLTYIHDIIPGLVVDWRSVLTLSPVDDNIGWMVILYHLIRLNDSELVYLKYGNICNITVEQCKIISYAIASCTIQNVMEIDDRVLKAIKAYNNVHVSLETLIQDYSDQLLTYETARSDAAAMSHLSSKKSSKSPNGKGLTYAEKMYRKAIPDILGIPPTQILHAVAYTGRNDSLYECSHLISELHYVLHRCNNPLIVNPSPAFIETYIHEKWNLPFLSK